MARHPNLTARWPLAGLATAFVALVAATNVVCGADLPPLAPPAASVSATADWTFQATFYGWLTAIDGDIGVRGRPMAPVNASIGEVLENLDGAVMGSFLAQNDQWLVLTDLVLARLSHDGRIGLDTELSQTVATGAVGHKLPLGLPNIDLAATAGLRYVRLSTDLNWSPAGLAPGWSGSRSEEWLDPTVGLVLQWAIDERWFLNAVADVGGFGVGSKLSGNGYLGLGYKWTPAISTAVGYRYLYEDYQDGGFRYEATMHGPTFSLGWHF